MTAAIKLKKGVSLKNVSPQAVLGIVVSAGVYGKYLDEMWVTSVNDSKHGYTSLHNIGNAFDLRSKTLRRDVVVEVKNDIKDALGLEWDVVLEDLGGDNEHIHVEWQPKSST